MSESGGSRRLTFIQTVSLCVCVINAFKTDATLKENEDVKDYVILPSGAIQLPPLNSIYPYLNTGPILILNETTIYITSLRYDNKIPDVYFRATTTISSTPILLLLNEDVSAKALHGYWGQNVYLRLPNSITIYNIINIDVWSSITKEIYGNITIPSNVEVSQMEENKDIKRIWLPKCCNIGEAYGSEGCSKTTQQFYPETQFLEMNSTHINNESLSYQCAIYLPYLSLLNCKSGKIALYPDEDQFLYLQNGSLLYMDERILLSQDQFCVETIEEMQTTLPFICLKSRATPEIIYHIYASGMLLSCLFFILTAAIFYFVFEDCKVRIRCIIMYSVCMAASFAILSSAQFFHVEGETCNAIGYILEFFFVLSFAWLAILSFETYYIIRHPSNERNQNRFKIYCGITVTVAVILVVLTAALSEIPFLPELILKPQFGHNSCVFDDKSQKTLIFYIPIFTGIVISIGYLAYTKYLIMKKSDIEEEYNRIKRNDLKNKFRACWLLVTIATVCWVMEILSFALNTQSGFIIAMDIIECLQGLFVFIIFVLHNPVKDKLTSKLCKKESHNQNGNVVDESFLNRLNEMDELRPLDGNSQRVPS